MGVKSDIKNIPEASHFDKAPNMLYSRYGGEHVVFG
jgi:hypothetical protein